MERIKTKISTETPEFKANKKAFQQLLEEYKGNLRQAMFRRNESTVNKHRKRGKLLARERIEILLDPQTPFLELSPLAAWGQYGDAFPSAGIVTGIGTVHGNETIIIANDATVKGGTYNAETIKKHLRAQEIAMENRLPCIYLVDSGGAFLPQQAEVFPDRFHFGRFFYNQSRLSAMGVPQISIVMGSCTAGGAYVPAMSDETIIVKDQGTIFIGGPPLVKAATGEEVTDEELGGAHVHTSQSGVADYLAEDDTHALKLCRDILQNYCPAQKQKLKTKQPEAPYYPPEELYGIAPLDLRKPIDAKEIIARIVDGSLLHEFKSNYGSTIVTGFAHIMGMPVGIMANNGAIFSETARKGAHFIQLCDQRKIPILFLQNITGFIVGKKYEQAGIARDGAKLIHAVANASVPKFTVVFGGSFGAGNYAMAGRAFDPRLLFMWPNAKISVMGGQQAANVLSSIKAAQLRSKGKQPTQKEHKQIEQEILQKYELEGSAHYSTSRIWDDGIIDPIDTRKVIAMGITTSLNKDWPEPSYGIFRM